MTGSELDPTPPGAAALLASARIDVQELIETGQIGAARRLTAATGVDFEATYFPMYFTGALDAELVMVHLNPRLSPRLSGPRFTDFDDYVEAHRRFGYHHWLSDPTYRSAFDMKQVRFVRPFGVVGFEEETDPAAKRRNAARVIDEKLQLELVPYASLAFPTHKLNPELLRPHFERVLNVVMDRPRRFVLFCGAVFDDLLDRSGLLVAREDHRFHLPTSAGRSKIEYRFSNIGIRSSRGMIAAAVARSFAIQGLPMAAYGEMCRQLYRPLV